MGFGLRVTESAGKEVDAGDPIGRRRMLSEIRASASPKARSPVHGYCRMDFRRRLQMAVFVPQHMRRRWDRPEIFTKRPATVERNAVRKNKRSETPLATDQDQTMRVTPEISRGAEIIARASDSHLADR